MLFVAEKSSLVRVTSMIFHPLVDAPPAHAGLFAIFFILRYNGGSEYRISSL